VLLSPACASFDQFRDFEARGDAFRQLVEGLP
jgi:UDP-N-acetylmuramoylalanine--D-glutamate ligase